jgi:hypothetical protein
MWDSGAELSHAGRGNLATISNKNARPLGLRSRLKAFYQHFRLLRGVDFDRDLWVTSPVRSCRVFRPEPSRAALFGVRAVLCAAESRRSSRGSFANGLHQGKQTRARPSTPPLILRQAEGETQLI